MSEPLFEIEMPSNPGDSGATREPVKRQVRQLPRSGVSWQQCRLKPTPFCHVCMERATFIEGVPTRAIERAYFQRTDKAGTTYWCGPHGQDKKSAERLAAMKLEGRKKGKKR